MSFEGSDGPRYVVPSYRAEGDTAFFHFLHGTVPGHQIDFMYRPDVPQGALKQTHFGHLSRLIKYIEPRQNAKAAFALGNLSRDDVQHEPGHGGLALLFALRVSGVTDHAGRDMPPYAHGVVAVDRALDYATLLEAITAFYIRFFQREGAEDQRGHFYRTYVQKVQDEPEGVEDFLAQYIGEFTELPKPPRSQLAWDFVADEAAPPRRINILHDDDEHFGTLVHHAASLGALLYRSNIKWTSITSGREIDIAGGTTIRFVPRSEAPSDTRSVQHLLDDLPEGEDELAALLFGAKRRVEAAPVPRQGWRERLAAQPRSEPPPGDSSSDPGSVDRAEVDDAAATLPMAPLEPDRPVAAAPPAFDPRRSSPMTGMSAAQAFDARRSSSTRGMPAPALPLAPALHGAPVADARVAPPASTRPGTFDNEDASVEVSLESPARGGRWMVVGAAVAAVIVIAIVAFVAGTAVDPATSGSGLDAPAPTSGGAVAPARSADTSPGQTTVSAPQSQSAQIASSASAAPTTAPAATSSPGRWKAPPKATTEKKAGGKPVF